MFILKSKQQISRAIENAKALHQKVKIIAFGEYQVSGSKGGTYTVLCYPASGQRIFDCNCPSRAPCKHPAAAALKAHLYMAARRGH